MIYINPARNLNADDTTLFSSLSSFVQESNHSMRDASAKINGEISKVTDWLTVNRLSLNVNKTKFMVFHYYQKTLLEANIPSLKINGSNIERVSEFNFLSMNSCLGVHIPRKFQTKCQEC